jgi:N-acetyl-anhydromuramyl-L-alanine amidase AmpD
MSAAGTKPRDPFRLEDILRLFVDFGVSSHYLIDREGVVRQLVPEERKAWHCGGSVMPPPDSRRGVNDFSIGVELVATAQSGYTDKQYDSCARLCVDIERRRGRMRYVGHEDIAGERAVSLGLRTDAKLDPGPLFDWPKLGRERWGAIEGGALVS